MKLTDIAASFKTEALAAVENAAAAMEAAGLARGAIVQAKAYNIHKNDFEDRIYYVTRIELKIACPRYGGPSPRIVLFGFLKRADGTFGNHAHCIDQLENCHLITPSNEAVTRALKKRGRI